MVAFYKYGDRTETFNKSLEGTDLVLRTLRRDIAFKLALRLKPVFDGASAVIQIDLVDPAGNPITEVAVNPVGSENYNDALFDFIEGNDEHLVHYKLLLGARDKWCHWAKILSWGILVLFSLELLIGGLLLWAKLASHLFSDTLIWGSLCLAGILILSCVIPLYFLLSAHDQIIRYRKKYASP